MTPVDQFLVLLTPLAIATAIASGAAFGVVIRTVRPSVDTHLTTFLAIVLGCCWYAPQAAQLLAGWLLEPDSVQPWGTLGRWCLYTFGFVVPMWIVLRWRKS